MAHRVRFLICGAQKSGTTALDAYLRRHPELIFPGVKEPHYFDRETIDWFGPREEREDGYHKMFDKAKTGLWGETTPVYLYWRASAERIWRYNPEMRLIAVLRNPITRAYSHWNMEIQRGRETLDFMEAIINEEHRCAESSPLQHRIYSYIDRGFYSTQLYNLWSWFKKEAVLILRQDDLLHRPDECLRECYRHLDIQQIPFAGPLKRHSRSYDKPVPEAALSLLKNIYKNEINCLNNLLGWECDDWLS
jgi:hypothetical protein